jgi:hypothetical protein
VHIASYQLGYVHIELAAICTEVDKLSLFVAISRQQALAAARRESSSLPNLWSVRARWRTLSSCAT